MMISEKTKFKFYKVKGLIILLVSLVSLFLVLPYGYWKSYTDNKNLEARAKFTGGVVINVTGLKEDRTLIEFYINGQRHQRMLTAPSQRHKYIGEHITVKYDSLDFQNVQAEW